jgi:RNA polymerase sigma-70 factor (ECF subfamily)
VSADDGDHTLVSRFLQRRDEEAFDALYRRHTPRVYGLALRLAGGQEPEAQDLVQETWVRAIARLGTFRGESRLSTWLCGICANVWREHLRRARPEVSLEAAPEPTAPGSRAGRVPPHEPIDVRRALERLAPGYRAVLVLHGIYGYPHAEVAELLGISVGTSKSQLLRGRRALLAALSEPEDQESPR